MRWRNWKNEALFLQLASKLIRGKRSLRTAEKKNRKERETKIFQYDDVMKRHNNHLINPPSPFRVHSSVSAAGVAAMGRKIEKRR